MIFKMMDGFKKSLKYNGFKKHIIVTITIVSGLVTIVWLTLLFDIRYTLKGEDHENHLLEVQQIDRLLHRQDKT